MRLRSFVVFACFLVLCSCSPARVRELPAARDPLILISLDGFRADYLARGFTPTLSALAADGVRAEAMKPSFPTLTFPNHYTLVTGLYPDHHGIVNNRMVDPATGKRFVYNDRTTTNDPAWWQGEPIWASVEKQGMHAATMFWPGSDVAIGGTQPREWLPFDGKMTPDQRVDQLLAWIDEPPAQRATFFTLYIEQIDHAGHDYGPDTDNVNAALREVDAALARLIDGLRQRGLYEHANIVVVSDHGMTATSAQRMIYLDDFIPLEDVEVVNYGILAGIEPHAGKTADVEARLLKPQEHAHCWRKTEVPARLHYGTHERIPPLLCLADDGWLISSHAYEATRKKKVSLGEHGYDNDDLNMRALFVAHGPAFKRGLVVPEFDNVDVYPLLAHLLHIRAQRNDGDFGVVRGILGNSTEN